MTIDNAYIETALTLAERSGGLLQKAFRTPMAADAKSDASPVTQADREAERLMRALLRERFPAHGIYGEEEGVTQADAEYVWVLDPIDGTKAFMAGIPTFSTLIALTHRGVPLLGVLHQPVTNELWLGVQGKVTTLNGAPVKTRACSALSQAILSTTSPYLFDATEKAAFETLRSAVRYSVYGADGYAYAMLATGGIDLVAEAGLKPHDVCALIPIIEGAGGAIADWQGKPLQPLASSLRVLAAGSRAVLAEAVACMRM